MKPLHLLPLCVLGIALAATAATVSVEEKEEGYSPLFNGRNLDGWTYGRRGDGENKSGKGYQVEDGMLFCTKGDGGNLFTAKEYGDFSFRFEFKLEENGNNGVGIRAPLEGDAAYVGMEIQILDDYGPEFKDKLRPAQYHGSIYDVVPAKRGALKPVGEWNSEEIAAQGRHITVTVNSQRIVDADLDAIERAVHDLEAWETKYSAQRPALGDAFEAIAKEKERLKRHPGLARAKGHIGFLGHGARIEFRNLRIKEL